MVATTLGMLYTVLVAAPKKDIVELEEKASKISKKLEKLPCKIVLPYFKK